jgi:hypothetical protein
MFGISAPFPPQRRPRRAVVDPAPVDLVCPHCGRRVADAVAPADVVASAGEPAVKAEAPGSGAVVADEAAAVSVSAEPPSQNANELPKKRGGGRKPA